MTAAARAIAHVEALARASTAAGEPVPDDVRRRARVTVTFHPDRADRSGRTAARGLATDGGYRNQFETGTSSGGLDRVLAGSRSEWERAMTGGAYDHAAPADRPRYGGLDLLGYPDGACPRFGSTHLRLRSHTLARCTFSWGDSVTRPTAVGTWATLGAVIAAARADAAPELDGVPRPQHERLDGYVEAQIHGGLSMTDVEAVVTDPCYRGTPTGDDLERACLRAGARLTWHSGYRLRPDDVDPAFRGPAATAMARAITDRFGCAVLSPAVLGTAATAITSAPTSWGPADPTATLQTLKLLWHHLAAFGLGGPG